MNLNSLIHLETMNNTVRTYLFIYISIGYLENLPIT